MFVSVFLSDFGVYIDGVGFNGLIWWGFFFFFCWWVVAVTVVVVKGLWWLVDVNFCGGNFILF